MNVPLKGDVYVSSGSLAKLLLSAKEVNLRAAGNQFAVMRTLRVCTLAAQELNKTSGYLPDFGRLALKVDRYESVLAGADAHLLQCVAARLVPDEVSEPRSKVEAPEPVAVKRDVEIEDLSAVMLARLRQGAPEVLFRTVGAAAADRLLLALLRAQELLRLEEPDGSRTQLAISPMLGSSLSTWTLDRLEIVSAVIRWSEPAPVLPAPVVKRRGSGFLH